MKKAILILVAFFTLQAGAAFPMEDTNPSKADLDKILIDFDHYAAKSMADWKIPGMAIGIVQDGKLIFKKGYGVKTSGGSDPVTEHTIFQIGSTTKAFTATLAAMLVDEGKINWDDKVIDRAPDFMMYDPWVTREFRIADLMAQRSGLPENAADTLYLLGFDRPYIRHAIRNIKPVSSFRFKYAYQNSLWLFVSEIIERYEGTTWEASLEKRIFNPLEMSDSSADMQSFLNAADAASLHTDAHDHVIALPKNWEYLDWSYIGGPAGAVNSNIVDMAKWLAFQMNNGKINGRRLVSEESMQILHSPETIVSPEGKTHKNAFYCLGWLYMEHSPYPIVWHNGGTLMKTMLAYVPEQNIGIVILSNYVTNLPEMLAFRFFDQYAGNPVKDASAEGLAEVEKMKKEERDKKPVAPIEPFPSMPLENYAGEYANDVYGVLKISAADGKLILAIGPKNVKMTLKHWDKDVFAVNWPVYGFDNDFGFAAFQVDAQRKITGVTLDFLNQNDDLGVFYRISPKKRAANQIL